MPSRADPGYRADLAAIHHQGFGDLARRAARALRARLGAAGHDRGTVVDLGCGSGIFAAELGAAGYDVLGVDLSEEMLALARVHAPQARLVCGSLFDVELPPAVAVAAIGECLNYAFDPRAGLSAIGDLAAKIRAALEPGGIWWFDLAGPGRVGAAPKERWVDRPEWTICYRATEAEGTLEREMITFTREGERHRRSEERHLLRLFAPAEVISILTDRGFEVETRGGYAGVDLGPGWTVFEAQVPRPLVSTHDLG